MAKDNENKDNQSTEQALYADYVQGMNPSALGEKYNLDSLAVLAMIEATQASKVKG